MGVRMIVRILSEWDEVWKFCLTQLEFLVTDWCKEVLSYMGGM